MSFKALKSFVGVGVTARKGAIINEINKDYAQKLVEGGFIEALESNEPEIKQKRTRTKKEV